MGLSVLCRCNKQYWKNECTETIGYNYLVYLFWLHYYNYWPFGPDGKTVIITAQGRYMTGSSSKLSMIISALCANDKQKRKKNGLRTRHWKPNHCLHVQTDSVTRGTKSKSRFLWCENPLGGSRVWAASGPQLIVIFPVGHQMRAIPGKCA